MPHLSLLLLSVSALLWLLLPIAAPFDGPHTNRRTWSAMIGLGAPGTP